MPLRSVVEVATNPLKEVQRKLVRNGVWGTGIVGSDVKGMEWSRKSKVIVEWEWTKE